MALFREQAQWDHTSQLLAVLINAHQDPRRRPVHPLDLHPLRDRRAATGVPLTVEGLRAVFGGRLKRQVVPRNEVVMVR